MAKWWQGVRKCPGEPKPIYSDEVLECFLYCDPDNSSKAASRREMAKGKKQSGRKGTPILKMCGMKGVGHDLNTPYHGYPFDVAW